MGTNDFDATLTRQQATQAKEAKGVNVGNVGFLVGLSIDDELDVGLRFENVAHL